MYDGTLEYFVTEDVFETFTYQIGTTPTSLTGATFDCWVRSNEAGADIIPNADIIITLANQGTDPGKFTLFISQADLPVAGIYVLRLHITIGGVETVYYNAKLCIED